LNLHPKTQTFSCTNGSVAGQKKEQTYKNKFCVLGFPNFNCSSAFSSFIGACLGKRMQKPLGAHQQRFDDRSEREHSCLHFTN
jgi:hypothetical protein